MILVGSLAMEYRQPKHFVADPFEFHQEIELTIIDVNNLGYGVGRVNNWVVTVPFVDIGEKVRAKIFRNHKNYSEADLIEVLEKSANRIEPKCKLFGQCGGCQYQHIKYAEQLNLKQQQVYQLFKRLAKIEVNINDVIHSEKEFGYRTKLTPHFEKPNVGKDIKIGFLANGCKRKIIDVEQCPIASDDINKVLFDIREEVLNNSSRYTNGATLLLRETIEGIATDNRDIAQSEVCGKIFSFQAGNFFQNNPYVLPKMIEHVISQARGTKFLVDSYCGVGIFGIIGAQHFEHVSGIELSEGAIQLAQHNAESNDVKNIKFVTGSAEKIFEKIEYNPNETSVVIDPPRSGCSEDFIDQLLKFAPKKIVYVSCAPDTQARDVKILAEKYSITCVQPIDLFPQTRHIENVVTLELKI